MTHFGISAIINTQIQFRRIQLILEDIIPTKSEELMYVREVSYLYTSFCKSTLFYNLLEHKCKSILVHILEKKRLRYS